MPAQDVSVNATFEEDKPAYTKYVSGDGHIEAVSLASYNESYTGGDAKTVLTEQNKAIKNKTYAELVASKFQTPNLDPDHDTNAKAYGENVLLAHNMPYKSGNMAIPDANYFGALTLLKVTIPEEMDTTGGSRIDVEYKGSVSYGSTQTRWMKVTTAPDKNIDELTFVEANALTKTDAGKADFKADGNAHDITNDAKTANGQPLYYIISSETVRQLSLTDFALKETKLYSVSLNETSGDWGTAKAVYADNNGDIGTTKIAPGTKVKIDLQADPQYTVTLTGTYGDSQPLTIDPDEHTFTMPEGDVTITVASEKLEGSPVTITVKYTNTGESTGSEIHETTIDNLITNGSLTDELAADVFKPFTVNNEAPANTFKRYTVTSAKLKKDSGEEVTLPLTLEETSYTFYLKAETDGNDYYEYETFDGDSTSSKFTLGGGLKDGSSFQGKVLWCRNGTEKWTYTGGLDDSLKVTYEQAFTYGKDKTNLTDFKNASGETIAEYTYHIGATRGTGYMQSVKIGGVEFISGTETGKELEGESWYNSQSQNKIGHVTLTMDRLNKIATLEFKAGTSVVMTYTGSIAGLKDMKLVTWQNHGGMNSDNNVPTINDFAVWQYKPVTISSALTLNDATGGTYQTQVDGEDVNSGSNVDCGKTVTITGSPTEPGQVPTVTVTGESGTYPVAVNGEDQKIVTFVMPHEAATVDVIFAAAAPAE